MKIVGLGLPIFLYQINFSLQLFISLDSKAMVVKKLSSLFRLNLAYKNTKNLEPLVSPNKIYKNKNKSNKENKNK